MGPGNGPGKINRMDKIEFYWSGFEPLLRIGIVGTLAYISIILILRVSGKRTLASMNAFDFVITVAIGSAFGRVLTARGVAVSEAIVAFILLAVLQYILSYIEIRSTFFRKFITSHPKILFYNGEFIEKNLRQERIHHIDLLGAVRKKGFGSLKDVEAIVLETDGEVSVIGKSKTEADQSSFKNLLEKETFRKES